MKDIIQEAQALLDQHGPESVRRANYFAPVVRGLLERIRELEQERDAALDQVEALEAPHV